MTATSSFDPPADTAPASPPNGGRFTGNERAFWRLLIRGAVLLLATLGIYRFWLATDVRRFLWSNTEIAGDGLEYIGTARELLLGFLIAIALLVPINAAFFLAALSRGVIGQIAGLLALIALALLGQFAVYRARRYRLSRTVYRGIRFHQTGSAWRYALCAIFWWAMIALTLGLAYPWALASLERFKLRNTYYGDLQGHFVGSGWKLFFRGALFWLVIVGSFGFGLLMAFDAVNWSAVGAAVRGGGDDIMGRVEAAGVAPALVVAVLSIGWSMVALAVLYPAFQAMVLRWWIAGLRFGALTPGSQLRTRAVYAIYLRFMWIALAAGVILAIGTAIMLAFTSALEVGIGKGMRAELIATAILIGTYVVIALAYSTIYQAAVKFRLWKAGFESVELSGLEALDNVKAVGAASSAVGEGLADALNVGGI
ncbi:MAG: DUF898 domain-containing protein [Alphaproteobacteria bacterium]|nr:MAG: DUF898 domain-containing protein [Alphaproteobacteria bacterium]